MIIREIMFNPLFLLILIIIGVVALFFVWLRPKIVKIGWLTLVVLYLFISLSLAVVVLIKQNIIKTDLNTPLEQTNLNCYKVDRIVDGDTLKIWQGGKSVAVRLIGIDTPESVDPRTPVQCFGKEASNYTQNLLVGEDVCLDEDVLVGKFDKYQRLLAYAYRKRDHLFINEHLVSQGYAHEYTYNSNYKYQQKFKEAERLAQEQKLGLWADGVCDDFKDNTNTPKDFNFTSLILEILKKRY